MFIKNPDLIKSFFGNSETGKLAQSIDWSNHTLGAVDNWEQGLKFIINIVMNSRFPMFIAWGKERFLFYNDAYSIILGKKHPAAFGQRFSDVWADIWSDLEPLVLTVDRGEAVYLENLKLIVNRKGYDEETYFTFSYSPIFSVKGSVQGLYCAVFETTARYMAEKNLQEHQDILKFALESSKMGTWKVDLITGKVKLSDEAGKIFGYISEYENADAAIENFILPKFRQHAKDVLQAAIAGDEPYNDEYQIERPDGEIRWINARGRVKLTEGKPTLLTGVILDITELKKVQEALEESIKIRDEFISIASHELKTPLTSLSLQNQRLSRMIAKEEGQNIPKEKFKEPMAVFQRQLNHLKELIDDMLDVSKIVSGKVPLKISPVNLSELVHLVLQRWEEVLSQKKIKVILDIEENVNITSDAFKLDQVITNLISNAVKYGEGKPITLIVKKVEKSAVLTVADQGMGINPDQQQKIFNRFERVTSAENISGLGLGLYISKQIVEALGGTIAVESSLGKGATFKVSLPL